MSLNKIIYAVILSITLLSCKKETALEPTPILPIYTFPQGDHPYDARIVDFYKNNGTYILYKFSTYDFSWNITNHIQYIADEADEAWVEPSLNFLDEHLFSFYSTSFVKKMLPYKIILSSRIRKLIVVDRVNVPDPTAPPVMSTYTYSHIAFGNCNSQLSSMDAEEIQAARAGLHSSLWSSAIQGERIELPPLFINATNYANVYSYNTAQNGVFLTSGVNSFTLKQDMIDYITMITTKTKAEIESTQFIPAKDPAGKFRLKYNAIIDYYKTTYQIDLQAIGGS